MAKEKGAEVPIVISTCRKDEQMCTIYAPLVQTQDFLLGLPDSETYLSGLPEEHFFLSYAAFKGGLYKVSPTWLREYVEMLP